jgi:DNA-binding LacI/PurR family transcriptional regulator
MAIVSESSRSKPVMMDVARLAGVSQKTVSRVVNRQPNVRPEVQERVEHAIRELGYRPNAAARALVTSRTHVIGVVTLGTALFGPTMLLFGLERAAWDAGYSVVVASTRAATSEEVVRAVHQLLDHGVDGIAVTGSGIVTSAPDGLLQGVPAVSVGDPLTAGLQCPAVMPDQQAGARAVTEHLLSLGHRTVWHVAGPTTWHATMERVRGWRETLEAADAEVHEPLAGDWSAESGYEAGKELAERSDLTAVFAANDQMAMGVMRALYERGRRIPEDVSVVGFDDQPESAFYLVPLTTVRQDFAAISARAIEELLAMIAGDEASAPVIYLPTRLVVRASSGRAPRSAAVSPM